MEIWFFHRNHQDPQSFPIFFVSLPSRDPWEATATKGKRVKGVASKGGKGGVGVHGGTRWWGWVAWRKVRGGGAQEKG
ncbi:hypothetical protein JHK87_048657 [Glycine soja]|nr:hypothetical protein JHK87_048657 [Glycine soja]